MPDKRDLQEPQQPEENNQSTDNEFWSEFLRKKEQRELPNGEGAVKGANPSSKSRAQNGKKPGRPAEDFQGAEGFTVPIDIEDEDELEPRDYMPIRGRRDGKLGCLGGMMYAVFVISLSVILACMGWLAASDVLALNKPVVSATISLPKTIFKPKKVEVKDEDGSVVGTKTVDAADIGYVAKTLKDNGIIRYEFLFKLYSKLSRAELQIDPGTYELNTSYDYRALVKKMQVGSDSQVETTVTFPEGFTMEQIFTRLEENGICSKEDLYEAAAEYEYSYTFLEGVGTGDAKRLEGFLFPDTYNFYQGMQASSAINKFLSNLHYKITADMWNTLKNRNMTFKEMMTVASMIESEAANDEERPIIASVIYNRLKAGIPLCIDATIQYILPEHVPVITEEQTRIDNPYNTYLYKGLPPGPISNPGMASINAALSPASTGYYYYALNMETGEHEFFKTEREHAAFVATQDYSQLGE